MHQDDLYQSLRFLLSFYPQMLVFIWYPLFFSEKLQWFFYLKLLYDGKNANDIEIPEDDC